MMIGSNLSPLNERKTFDICRFIQMVFCGACFACCLYFILQTNSINYMVFFVTIIAIIFLLLTIIDIISRTLEEPIAWTSWLIISIIAAFCFFLGAGMLIIHKHYMSPASMYTVGILYAFTGYLFLRNVIIILRRASDQVDDKHTSNYEPVAVISKPDIEDTKVETGETQYPSNFELWRMKSDGDTCVKCAPSPLYGGSFVVSNDPPTRTVYVTSKVDQKLPVSESITEDEIVPQKTCQICTKCTQPRKRPTALRKEFQEPLCSNLLVSASVSTKSVTTKDRVTFVSKSEDKTYFQNKACVKGLKCPANCHCKQRGVDIKKKTEYIWTQEHPSNTDATQPTSSTSTFNSNTKMSVIQSAKCLCESTSSFANCKSERSRKYIPFNERGYKRQEEIPQRRKSTPAKKQSFSVEESTKRSPRITTNIFINKNYPPRTAETAEYPNLPGAIE